MSMGSNINYLSSRFLNKRIRLNVTMYNPHYSLELQKRKMNEKNLKEMNEKFSHLPATLLGIPS